MEGENGIETDMYMYKPSSIHVFRRTICTYNLTTTSYTRKKKIKKLRQSDKRVAGLPDSSSEKWGNRRVPPRFQVARGTDRSST